MRARLRRIDVTSASQVVVGVFVSLVLLFALNHAAADAGQPDAADLRASPAQSPEQPASPAARPKANQPNIIMIMTDDESVSDQRVLRKVNQKLGQRGTTFTRAFSPYPLCCPARATMLTGQYAHNHHVMGNRRPYGGFSAFDDSSTLPVWLKDAGYNTIMLGKYLNGYPGKTNPTYIPPGWDTWRVPIAHIYDYWRWTLNADGIETRYHGQYQTNFVGDEAVDLIDEYSSRDKPYFMWAGFLAPHSGSPIEPDDPRSYGNRMGSPAVAPRYKNRYNDVRLPNKESINEKYVGDKPVYIRDRHRLSRRWLAELRQQRMESLRSVDDQVARIVAAVKAHGDLKNTVFIFTSDNGYMTGEHRKVAKLLGYEESTRVPLIIAGPGFDTRSEREQKVSLVDIAPTIAQIAGAQPRIVEDGIQLRQIAADPQFPDTRSLLFQAGPHRSNPDRWYTALRTKRYVYVHWDNDEHELYDLVKDPEQLRSVAGNPKYAALEYDLATTLEKLQNCAGRSCLTTVPSTVEP